MDINKSNFCIDDNDEYFPYGIKISYTMYTVKCIEIKLIYNSGIKLYIYTVRHSICSLEKVQLFHQFNN